MINLELEEVQEILNQFLYLTNDLCFKPQKTAEELRDSFLMKDLDLCWIRICSSNNYKTDLRNEASAQVSRQLAEIPFVKEKLKKSNNTKMEKVAQKMAQRHRTLQQSFSELVYYHFWLICDRHETQILTDIMGEDFYILPLI